MVSAQLSKDIEVEVLFTKHPNNNEEHIDSENHALYFIFDEIDIWQVGLWQEKAEQTFLINTPTRFFVEFEFPQSLSGRLTPGKAFDVLQGEIVGKGFILEIINLDERAQEYIENIVQRPRDEVHQILEFNESLFGEPRFTDINE